MREYKVRFEWTDYDGNKESRFIDLEWDLDKLNTIVTSYPNVENVKIFYREVGEWNVYAY